MHGEQLAKFAEGLPAAPAIRACRQALEAAAQAVTAVRKSAAKATDQEYSAKVQEWEKTSEPLLDMGGQLRVDLEVPEAHADEVGLASEFGRLSSEYLSAVQAAQHSRDRGTQWETKFQVCGEAKAALWQEVKEARKVAAKARSARLAVEHRARSMEMVEAVNNAAIQEELQVARQEAEKRAEELKEARLAMGRELEQVHADGEEAETAVRGGLDAECEAQKEAYAEARARHLQLAEQAQEDLDRSVQRHADDVNGLSTLLLDAERCSGQLEGRLATLTTEVASLSARASELQAQLANAREA